MPRGGWAVLWREIDIVDRDPKVVLRLRRPSHSTDSSSPMGSMFTEAKVFASSASLLFRATEKVRRIAAPPRRVSALGSYSGSSCSATVRIWSRSPLKTAVSGTSLADLESCSRTTPEQICKKPMTTVAMVVPVPLNPWKRMADVTIVALVKKT